MRGQWSNDLIGAKLCDSNSGMLQVDMFVLFDILCYVN